MKIVGIYGLRNRRNGRWYIGYSNNIINRWNWAYKKAKCVGQPKIYAALKKYGYDNFEKVVLEECSDDRDVWGPKETYWITKYDSIKNGYNTAPGGCGGAVRTGIPCKEHVKRRLSALFSGQSLTTEHRQKISEGLRQSGRTISDDQRKKMLAGRYKPTREEKLAGNRRRQAEYRARKTRCIAGPS